MLKIHQADQFSIAFSVKSDGVVLAPDNIEAIRIAVGYVVHEFPNGALTHENGMWMFPLTSSQTAHMNGEIKCQVEVKAKGTRNHSDTFTINVQKSILRGGWNVEN